MSASRSLAFTWSPYSGPTSESARPASANSATTAANSSPGVGPCPPTTTSRQPSTPRSRRIRAARASSTVPLRRQITPTKSTVAGTRSALVGSNDETSTALSTVSTRVRPANRRIVAVPASETVQTRAARRSERKASLSSAE